jgi:putative flippase GtrA
VSALGSVVSVPVQVGRSHPRGRLVDVLSGARVWRFPRFALVGAIGVGVNDSALYVLHGRLGIDLLLAAAMATELAILNNFFWNDRWTFRKAIRSGSVWGRALRYNLVAAGGLVVSLCSLAVLAHGFHVPYLLANLFAIGTGVVWNYRVGSRFAWAIAHRRSLAWARLTPGGATFLFFLALYLATATWLVFVAHVVIGDAMSRVTNADYVLFSRDPHLAAIGFVWNPLPSLLEMPLLLFKGILPALLQLGFASNLVSAVAMAGAVHQVHTGLADFKVPRSTRLVVTLLFGLHPMIWYYAANGMSEALYIFFLVLAAVQLMRWLQTMNSSNLVGTGLALAAAYLTRYEAAIAAAGVCLLVCLVSLRRAQGDSRSRLATAATDGFIAVGPFALAFAVWAITSWVIVGSPFEQFASVYGNSSQAAASEAVYGPHLNSGVAVGLIQAWFLEPMALVAMLAGLAVAIRRRDARVLAILSITLPIYVFVVFGLAHNLLFGWMRFFILVIPASVLTFGAFLSPKPRTVRPRQSTRLRYRLTSASRGAFLSVAVLGVALLLTPVAMLNGRIGVEEASVLEPVVAAHGHGALPVVVSHDAQIASYLDGLNLPPGSVLVDTFLGFPIVANSENQTQFVITSDRDFRSTLSDPAGAGVKYLLVPDPRGAAGRLDAINRFYPGIYDTGAGIATLVSQFGEGWRLYEVNRAP